MSVQVLASVDTANEALWFTAADEFLLTNLGLFSTSGKISVLTPYLMVENGSY